MKKFAAIVLAALVAVALFANGSTEEASSGFTPTKDVSWVCLNQQSISSYSRSKSVTSRL